MKAIVTMWACSLSHLSGCEMPVKYSTVVLTLLSWWLRVCLVSTETGALLLCPALHG